MERLQRVCSEAVEAIAVEYPAARLEGCNANGKLFSLSPYRGIGRVPFVSKVSPTLMLLSMTSDSRRHDGIVPVPQILFIE
jgi:hypothetical protein